MENMLNTFNIKRILIILFIVAIFPIDTVTDYYYLMRLIIFVSMIYLIIKEKANKKPSIIFSYVIIGVLWNPFETLMVSFPKNDWVVLDLLAIFLLYKFSLNEEEKDELFKFKFKKKDKEAYVINPNLNSPYSPHKIKRLDRK